jgi:hypothetical protein
MTVSSAEVPEYVSTRNADVIASSAVGAGFASTRSERATAKYAKGLQSVLMERKSNIVRSATVWGFAFMVSLRNTALNVAGAPSVGSKAAKQSVTKSSRGNVSVVSF